MKVAIHQPNFMPWLGAFHKAAMADRFVVFDHVQAMGGPSWFTRNRILVQGDAHWFTIPIRRSGQGLPAINEVQIQWENRLVTKQLRTLEASYGRHPHFAAVFGLITELYDSRPELLAELNATFFARVLGELRLDVDLVWSSDLVRRDPSLGELSGSTLVLETCRAAGGDAYISGEGSLEYIDPPEFERAGVSFWFQRYAHPEYPQLGAPAFVSHLSVIDALFNLGFAGVRGLVEHESREAVTGGVA
jgi:hypothetical protein